MTMTKCHIIQSIVDQSGGLSLKRKLKSNKAETGYNTFFAFGAPPFMYAQCLICQKLLGEINDRATINVCLMWFISKTRVWILICTYASKCPGPLSTPPVTQQPVSHLSHHHSHCLCFLTGGLDCIPTTSNPHNKISILVLWNTKQKEHYTYSSKQSLSLPTCPLHICATTVSLWLVMTRSNTHLHLSLNLWYPTVLFKKGQAHSAWYKQLDN